MNKSDILMLDLLGRALFNNEADIPDNCDWNSLFEEAMQQAVLPIVFNSLKSSELSKINIDISEACRNQTMLMYTWNTQAVYEQNEIIKLFDEHEILYVILKGTSSSAYYPNPLIRPMGDIDIFVRETDYDKAKELLKSNGYKESEENIRNVTLIKNRIPVELHKRFSFTDDSEISPLAEKFIVDGLSERELSGIEGFEFYELPSIPKGLVLLEHIRFHLFNGGIGIRQFCDWAVYLNNCINPDDWKALEGLLKKLGYWNFAGAVTKACIDWLHLPESTAPWAANFDKTAAKELIEAVCEDGNFGSKIKNNNDYTIRMFQKDKNTFSSFVTVLIERSKVIFKPCRKNALLIPIGLILLLFKHLKLRISGDRKSFKAAKLYSKANKRNKLYSKMKFQKTDGK